MFELNIGKCFYVLGLDIFYFIVIKNGCYMLCINNFNDIVIWNLEIGIKEK